jgi:hypothetical protein
VISAGHDVAQWDNADRGYIVADLRRLIAAARPARCGVPWS